MAIFGTTQLTSLTSGSLWDIMNLDLTGLTIACDDTYLTESTTDEYGNPLPPGVTQPVSQWISTYVNSIANHFTDQRVTPPLWFATNKRRCRDTAPDGSYLSAVSDGIIRWITICPRTLQNEAAAAPPNKDQDISATGSFIDNIRPLSTTLLHECLHILFPTFSKWFSPLSRDSKPTDV